MPVGNFHLGETDAKNEILREKRSGKSVFFDSFLIPDNVDIEKLKTGESFFVTGYKGTGKTALLRYVDKIVRDEGCETNFTLFKSDINEHERSLISKDAKFSLVNSKEQISIEQDFLLIWKWYLLLKASESIVKSDTNLKILQNITEYFQAGKGVVKSLLDYLPKFQKGTLTAKLDAKISSIILTGEFSENTKNEKPDELHDFLNICNALERRVISSCNKSKKVYIFIDELEIFHESQHQYDLDRRMLRDLIRAITHLNSLFIENSLPIFIICAVRLEVLRSIYEIGQEIGRDVRDFEIHLDWNISGAQDDHPLLTMVQKRVELSETESERNDRINNKNSIWTQYFPEQYQTTPFKKYLLHNSFYRPRDIVRFLSTASRHKPQSPKFTHEMFDRTVKNFSEETWLEISEELMAKYSYHHIKIIKYLFRTHKPYFKYEDFEARLRMYVSRPLSKFEEDQNKYLINMGIKNILHDLYRVGAIGNFNRYNKNYRFIFRGDGEPHFDVQFIVHRALWREFEIEN